MNNINKWTIVLSNERLLNILTPNNPTNVKGMMKSDSIQYSHIIEQYDKDSGYNEDYHL